MHRWAWVVLLSGCGAVLPGSTAEPAWAVEAGCSLLLGSDAYRQGALVETMHPTDLALSGSGFFQLEDRGSVVYTRNGHFDVDGEGFLRGAGPYRLQGFMAGSTLVTALEVGPSVQPPQPTQNVTVHANLDASAPVQVFDPSGPQVTANSSSTLTIYDLLGRAHEVELFWNRTGPGSWAFHAMADGVLLEGGAPGMLQEVATGSLDFDDQGRLRQVSQRSDFTPLGASAPQALTFDFGLPTSLGGSGLEGVTGFSSPSTTSFLAQDGYPMGLLLDFSIDLSGRLEGRYSNGHVFTLGQVALARFPFPTGLHAVNHDLLLSSAESGEAILGRPGDGGLGSLISFALEQLPSGEHRCFPAPK